MAVPTVSQRRESSFSMMNYHGRWFDDRGGLTAMAREVHDVREAYDGEHPDVIVLIVPENSGHVLAKIIRGIVWRLIRAAS